MRILVTGGAGFFGSHIVDALRARGDDVVALDDLSTGARANIDPAVPLVVADISDRERLRDMLAGERFDGIVHAAAKTKVVESIAQPALYHRVIVNGTSNALDVAQGSGAAVFVNVSTGGALYGETPAAKFGPAALRAVRSKLIESGLCIRTIRDRMGIIRRMVADRLGDLLRVNDALAG